MSVMHSSPLSFRDAVLERIDLRFDKHIDKYLLIEQRFDVFEFTAGQMLLELRGYLLGEKTNETIITYPLDWWEAFKERWFPLWAKKRWPVKRKTHKISFNILYPDYKLALKPWQQRHVIKMAEYSYDSK